MAFTAPSDWTFRLIKYKGDSIMEVNFTLIGIRIAKIRKERNLSQMELAEFTHFTLSGCEFVATASSPSAVPENTTSINPLPLFVSQPNKTLYPHN